MNKFFSNKSIYLYTLPVILSELLEEAMILSDSILLSFKDPLFLSTVGIIDSILLLCLALGDSMNDSFQNFYSRHSNDVARCRGVFSNSLFLFTGVGVILGLLSCTIPLFKPIFGGSHFEILVFVVPYLAILVALSFISMSLNSLLMGWGYTKYLGMVSLVSVLTNLLLGYLLLYIFDIGINPCAIILITSSIAECIAIFFMLMKIINIHNSSNNLIVVKCHQTTILKILVFASVYPCVTDIGFHVGSLALYSYCLFYFQDSETAMFTLFMSYWGMLQVPSQGFSETAINIFSDIYTRKLINIYDRVKKRIVSLSILSSLVFLLIILILDISLYETSIQRLSSFAILFGIISLNTFSEITETSLLVRLKNDSFIVSKIVYAAILISCIVAFTITNHIGLSYMFICFMVAQLINSLYLGVKDHKIWHQRMSDNINN